MSCSSAPSLRGDRNGRWAIALTATTLSVPPWRRLQRHRRASHREAVLEHSLPYAHADKLHRVVTSDEGQTPGGGALGCH
jgi:hypothetical protein